MASSYFIGEKLAGFDGYMEMAIGFSSAGAYPYSLQFYVNGVLQLS